MNLFRLALGTGMVGLLGLGLSGCLAEPTYSSTPEISFNDINLTYRPSVNQSSDSVNIVINYQDGDGDLGLASTATGKAPYVRRYANNYFVQAFVKSTNGQFVPLSSLRRGFSADSVNAYYSRFDPIVADNRGAPIKGTLKWKAIFYRTQPFLPGEEVRFQISVADQALHESNTITTNSIIISK